MAARISGGLWSFEDSFIEADSYFAFNRYATVSRLAALPLSGGCRVSGRVFDRPAAGLLTALGTIQSNVG